MRPCISCVTTTLHNLRSKSFSGYAVFECYRFYKELVSESLALSGSS